MRSYCHLLSPAPHLESGRGYNRYWPACGSGLVGRLYPVCPIGNAVSGRAGEPVPRVPPTERIPNVRIECARRKEPAPIGARRWEHSKTRRNNRHAKPLRGGGPDRPPSPGPLPGSWSPPWNALRFCDAAAADCRRNNAFCPRIRSPAEFASPLPTSICPRVSSN